MPGSLSSWCVSSIASEGYRNWRFGRWATTVLVLVVTNDDAGGIVSSRCDGLDRVPGVAGAAALSRWPTPFTLSSVPDAPVTVIGATSGVTDLLAIDACRLPA